MSLTCLPALLKALELMDVPCQLWTEMEALLVDY